MNLTHSQLTTITNNVMPKNGISKYAMTMVETFKNFELNTVNRIAGFLAQTGHESGRFNRIEENLNYSAERLQVVFKKYFPTEELAKKYANDKRSIANRVYGGRLGNGPELTGDGWKYRGRGLIQLTGKNNYSSCAKDMGLDIIDNPDLLLLPEIAVLASIWFWDKNQINRACDADDIVLMTRMVQGGRLGLEERKKYYEAFKKELTNLS